MTNLSADTIKASMGIVGLRLNYTDPVIQAPSPVQAISLTDSISSHGNLAYNQGKSLDRSYWLGQPDLPEPTISLRDFLDAFLKAIIAVFQARGLQDIAEYLRRQHSLEMVIGDIANRISKWEEDAAIQTDAINRFLAIMPGSPGTITSQPSVTANMFLNAESDINYTTIRNNIGTDLVNAAGSLTSSSMSDYIKNMYRLLVMDSLYDIIDPDNDTTTGGVDMVDQIRSVIENQVGISTSVWDSSTSYASGDIVQYGSYYYQARSSNTGVTPPTNNTTTSTWQSYDLLAETKSKLESSKQDTLLSVWDALTQIVNTWTNGTDGVLDVFKNNQNTWASYMASGTATDVISLNAAGLSQSELNKLQLTTVDLSTYATHAGNVVTTLNTDGGYDPAVSYSDYATIFTTDFNNVSASGAFVNDASTSSFADASTASTAIWLAGDNIYKDTYYYDSSQGLFYQALVDMRVVPSISGVANWSSSNSYIAGQIISDGTAYYEAKTAISSGGTAPSVTSGSWTLVDVYETYSNSTSYSLGDFVAYTNGTIYQAIGKTVPAGENPSTEVEYWAPIYYTNSGFYSIDSSFAFQKGLLAHSLIDASNRMASVLDGYVGEWDKTAEYYNGQYVRYEDSGTRFAYVKPIPVYDSVATTTPDDWQYAQTVLSTDVRNANDSSDALGSSIGALSSSSSWNSTIPSSTNSYGTFLGPFSGTSYNQDTLEQTLSLSGQGSIIEFDFLRLASWDISSYNTNINESFCIYANDELVVMQPFGDSTSSSADGAFQEAYSVLTGSYGGYSYTFTPGDYDASILSQKYHVVLTVPAGVTTLNLAMLSNLNQGSSDESWGIQNFSLQDYTAGNYNIGITQVPFDASVVVKNSNLAADWHYGQTNLDSVTGPHVLGQSGLGDSMGTWVSGSIPATEPPVCTTISSFGTFLGPFGGSNREQDTLYREIALPGTTPSAITFKFYRLDSWDPNNSISVYPESTEPEAFCVYANNNLILNQSFVCNNPETTTLSGGEGGYTWQMVPGKSGPYGQLPQYVDSQEFYVTIIVPTGVTTLDLAMLSTVNEGSGNEAWGISDFAVNGVEVNAGWTPATNWVYGQTNLGTTNGPLMGQSALGSSMGAWVSGSEPTTKPPVSSNNDFGKLIGPFSGGGYQQDTLFRTLDASDLQAGTNTVTFNFYRMDSWDGQNINGWEYTEATQGESFCIYANDTLIMNQALASASKITSNLSGSSNGYSWTMVPGQYGSFGPSNSAWGAQQFYVTLTIPSGVTSVDLAMLSTLNSPNYDESWGISNFQVNGKSIDGQSNILTPGQVISSGSNRYIVPPGTVAEIDIYDKSIGSTYAAGTVLLDGSNNNSYWKRTTTSFPVFSTSNAYSGTTVVADGDMVYKLNSGVTISQPNYYYVGSSAFSLAVGDIANYNGNMYVTTTACSFTPPSNPTDSETYLDDFFSNTSNLTLIDGATAFSLTKGRVFTYNGTKYVTTASTASYTPPVDPGDNSTTLASFFSSLDYFSPYSSPAAYGLFTLVSPSTAGTTYWTSSSLSSWITTQTNAGNLESYTGTLSKFFTYDAGKTALVERRKSDLITLASKYQTFLGSNPSKVDKIIQQIAVSTSQLAGFVNTLTINFQTLSNALAGAQTEIELGQAICDFINNGLSSVKGIILTDSAQNQSYATTTAASGQTLSAYVSLLNQWRGGLNTTPPNQIGQAATGMQGLIDDILQMINTSTYQLYIDPETSKIYSQNFLDVPSPDLTNVSETSDLKTLDTIQTTASMQIFMYNFIQNVLVPLKYSILSSPSAAFTTSAVEGSTLQTYYSLLSSWKSGLNTTNNPLASTVSSLIQDVLNMINTSGYTLKIDSSTTYISTTYTDSFMTHINALPSSYQVAKNIASFVSTITTNYVGTSAVDGGAEGSAGVISGLQDLATAISGTISGTSFIYNEAFQHAALAELDDLRTAFNKFYLPSTYSASTQYDDGDGASDGSGHYYKAKRSTQGNALTNTTYWEPINLSVYLTEQFYNLSGYATSFVGSMAFRSNISGQQLSNVMTVSQGTALQNAMYNVFNKENSDGSLSSTVYGLRPNTYLYRQYDSTTTYSPGEIVLKEGNYYVAAENPWQKTPITKSGTYTYTYYFGYPTTVTDTSSNRFYVWASNITFGPNVKVSPSLSLASSSGWNSNIYTNTGSTNIVGTSPLATYVLNSNSGTPSPSDFYYYYTLRQINAYSNSSYWLDARDDALEGYNPNAVGTSTGNGWLKQFKTAYLAFAQAVKQPNTDSRSVCAPNSNNLTFLEQGNMASMLNLYNTTRGNLIGLMNQINLALTREEYDPTNNSSWSSNLIVTSGDMTNVSASVQSSEFVAYRIGKNNYHSGGNNPFTTRWSENFTSDSSVTEFDKMKAVDGGLVRYYQPIAASAASILQQLAGFQNFFYNEEKVLTYNSQYVKGTLKELGSWGKLSGRFTDVFYDIYIKRSQMGDRGIDYYAKATGYHGGTLVECAYFRDMMNDVYNFAKDYFSDIATNVSNYMNIYNTFATAVATQAQAWVSRAYATTSPLESVMFQAEGAEDISPQEMRLMAKILNMLMSLLVSMLGSNQEVRDAVSELARGTITLTQLSNSLRLTKSLANNLIQRAAAMTSEMIDENNATKSASADYMASSPMTAQDMYDLASYWQTSNSSQQALKQDSEQKMRYVKV